MKHSFGSFLWIGVTKANSFIGGFISIFISILVAYISSNIWYGIILSIIFFLSVLVYVFSYTSYEIYKAYEKEFILAKKMSLPRIIRAQRPPPSMLQASALCLTESSDLFSYGIGVSFYNIDEDGFEKLIGLGKVENVQEDKRLQITILHIIEGHENIIERLLQNESRVLENTRVKPNAPLDI
ncbi:hypothetical protein F8S13_22295 [Chloroflexia bacterium SDU3-3]|nr:hypothetical protein F8S13_22295 [Chloroflexia bacterium SDU3-3]